MAGKTFRYEYEMAGVTAEWLRSQGLSVRREFATPAGICDFVGAALNPEMVEKRLQLGQRRAIGPVRRVDLFNRIPENKAVTLRKLAREYAGFLDERELVAELDRLVAYRFVGTPRRGLYQKINGWIPLHQRIVAVELKLSRISDVLCQAATRLEFADESYIGLPIDVARRLLDGPRRADLGEAGVGLLGITHRACTVLLEPSSVNQSANKTAQMHCAERFWRAYLRGNSS